MDKFNERFAEIMEGSDKIKRLEDFIAFKVLELQEMKLSAGMVKGFAKTANIAKECGGCGFGIPKYSGRYPNYCPSCGETLEAGNMTPLDED